MLAYRSTYSYTYYSYTYTIAQVHIIFHCCCRMSMFHLLLRHGVPVGDVTVGHQPRWMFAVATMPFGVQKDKQTFLASQSWKTSTTFCVQQTSVWLTDHIVVITVSVQLFILAKLQILLSIVDYWLQFSSHVCKVDTIGYMVLTVCKVDKVNYIGKCTEVLAAIERLIFAQVRFLYDLNSYYHLLHYRCKISWGRNAGAFWCAHSRRHTKALDETASALSIPLSSLLDIHWH